MKSILLAGLLTLSLAGGCNPGFPHHTAGSLEWKDVPKLETAKGYPILLPTVLPAGLSPGPYEEAISPFSTGHPDTLLRYTRGQDDDDQHPLGIVHITECSALSRKKYTCPNIDLLEHASDFVGKADSASDDIYIYRRALVGRHRALWIFDKNEAHNRVREAQLWFCAGRTLIEIVAPVLTPADETALLRMAASMQFRPGLLPTDANVADAPYVATLADFDSHSRELIESATRQLDGSNRKAEDTLVEVGPAVVPLVEPSLRSPSSKIRYEAMHIVARACKAHPQTGLAVLIPMLKQADEQDQGELIRRIVALDRTAPVGDVLLQIARSEAFRSNPRSEQSRLQKYAVRCAVEALGKLRPVRPDVLPELVRRAHDEDSDIQDSALEALYYLGPAGGPSLNALLHSSNPDVWDSAADAAQSGKDFDAEPGYDL